ncbi:MAG: replication initiator protein [Microvirus sp.]|nr:MAG: replication initiator protein [Microvirus sp.]
MTCYRPLSAFQDDEGKVVFSEQLGSARVLTLPCGRCVGCRIDRSRAWAMRCVHEAQMHDHNCFLTLTYDDSHLPQNGSLRYVHFQRFMKRLRKQAGKPVRFYMCGEYGDKLTRPHYHACIFGYDFYDKVPWSSGGGSPLFRSAHLESLWPFGFSSVGEVTFESAAYVAAYCMKKVVGSGAADHYERVSDTGEIFSLVPEFTRMSLKPGIGASWFDKFFESDVRSRDGVMVSGRRLPVPRYYDQLLAKRDALALEAVQFDRSQKVTSESRVHSTPERLAVREAVSNARINLKSRGLSK